MSLRGVQVLVPPNLPHRVAKVKRWQKSLSALGAQLVEGSSAHPTHILWDSSAPAPVTVSGAKVVASLWLEHCLAENRHVAEAGYLRPGQVLPQALVNTNNSTDTQILEHCAGSEPAAASLPKPATEGMPAVKCKESQPGTVSDVQQALLWLLADGINPEFIDVQHAAAVPSIVMMMLPGLDQTTFNKHQLSRSLLTVRDLPQAGLKRKHSDLQDHTPQEGASHYQHSSARSSTDAEIVVPPVSQQSQSASNPQDAALAQSQQAQQDAESSSPVGCQFPLGHYQATVNQMRSCGYPLPLKGQAGQDVLPDGFVSTSYSGLLPSKHQSIVAVDCEMCYTQAALELARVTLVGKDEEVLLDELVLPNTPIVHYNTAYSGITPAIMQGVTTRLTDAQQHVLQFVGPDTFLVGHALDNDLKVLKLIHLKNLDTGIMFPHSRWPVQLHSLRSLTQTHLQWVIQQGSHDSKEDAIAALRLVQLKQKQGPFFGVGTTPGTQNLLDILSHHRRDCKVFDRQDVLGWHDTERCPGTDCATDGQAVQEATKCLQNLSVDFCWLQLWGLADLYETRMYNKGARTKWPYPADQLAAAEPSAPLEDCLQQLDAYIGKVHEAMKPGSLLLVCTGPGDTTQQRCKEEAAKEARYAQQLATATGSVRAPQAALRTHNQIASNVLLFSCVKS